MGTEPTPICLECGSRCCRGPFLVFVDDAEAERFASLAAARGQELRIERRGAVAYWRNDQQVGGQCPFLDAAGRCSVYEQRPAGCRAYPEHYSPGCRLSGWTPAEQVFVATVHGKTIPFEFLPMRDTIFSLLAGWGIFGGSTCVTGVRVDDNRNQAIAAFLKSEASHLLFLDDDMVFPWDVGLRLLSHQVDVVGGLYFQRQWPEAVYPHFYRFSHRGPDRWGQEGDLFRTMDEEVYLATSHLPRTDEPMIDQAAKLLPIDAGGAGCLLIHRRVLEALPPPWFHTEGATNGDLMFFWKAKQAGFEVWGDPGCVCSHYASHGVGLAAFRTKLLGEIEARRPAAEQKDANTPEYWDYVHGSERQQEFRRDYAPSDGVYAELLKQWDGAARPVVVDLGCGRSSTYLHLREARPDVAYTGVDYSEVAQADNRKHFPGAEWIVGDVRSWDPPEAVADLAMSNHTIEHLAEPAALVAKLWKLTKPGGYVGVALPVVALAGNPPGEHIQDFDYDQIIKILTRYSRAINVYPVDPARPVLLIQKPA